MAVKERSTVRSNVGSDTISDRIEVAVDRKGWIILDGKFQRFDTALRRVDDLRQFVGDIDHATDAVGEDLLELPCRILSGHEDMRSDLSDVVVDENRYYTYVGRRRLRNRRLSRI